MSDIQDAIEAATAQAAAAHAADELAAAGIAFRDWREFMANEPPPFDWIITDIVAHGMKGDLNAKSKQWKSFFGMQLALCISAGQSVLGMQVPKARRCAYFNLELSDRGAWERGAAMGTATGATPADNMLYVVNLRGKADRLREHTPALVAEVSRLEIDLVILDPRYKLIGDGEDENSAAGLRGVLQFRDALAETAAVLMIGHDPKGSTEGKSMADRGAGSYTAGADYDFSFALSPHELDGYTVLSTSCRYRQSPPDLTIRFDPERQIFDADPDTPAAVKQTRRGGGGASSDPKDKAKREKLKLNALEDAVRNFADQSELMGMGTFRQSIRATPEGAAFGRDSLRTAIDSLVEKGVIAKTPAKVRTEDGSVKNIKNGGWLVGSPEKIKEYDSKFSVSPATNDDLPSPTP